MFSSSAAFDLLPLLTFSAQLIRLDSTSFSRSSSEMADGWSCVSTIGSWSSAYLWNSTLTGTQPTRTVSQVQVCAMRSQAFSSSRTLPGHG